MADRWRGLRDDWEGPLTGGGLQIWFEWEEVEGRLECVGVRITPDRGGATRRVITTSLMREISWSALIEKKKEVNLRRAHKWAETKKIGISEIPVDPELIAEARKMVPAWESSLLGSRRGRPRELNPDDFARVAQVYTDAYRAGLPPTKAVAEKFNLSRSGAAKRVARARRDGLLPKTRQRVAKASGRKSGRGER
jgi:hypothetical protein